VPVAEDLGSGHLEDTPGHPLSGIEPSVQTSIAAGVDVCCFSGDKLLGGPQAGIIAGRKAPVDAIRRHPLMRALRVDKLTYAALEATLVEYASGRASSSVPVQRMVMASSEELRARADALAAAINRLPGWSAGVVQGTSAVGGGSAPGAALPTWLVAVSKDGTSLNQLERMLREASPPVIARIDQRHLLLDLRTVVPADDETLVTIVRGITL
jgi:L-seryl-tRNA(Ser) seleniumtransferase